MKPKRPREGTAHGRKTPSAATKFEMKIRADVWLNVTARLLWLLTALSHRRGYTYLTKAAMAGQLGTSVRQVQISLRVVIEAGYFRQVRPTGIHRPRQYHRVYEENESPDEFVRRIRSDGSRFDLAVLLHWIACDMTAASGKAQFPTPPEWSASRAALTLARRKMQKLGHFAVDSDPRRGNQSREGVSSPPDVGQNQSHQIPELILRVQLTIVQVYRLLLSEVCDDPPGRSWRPDRPDRPVQPEFKCRVLSPAHVVLTQHRLRRGHLPPRAS